MSYSLTVFSHRWGHTDDYKIELTATGWDVQFRSIGGSCNNKGTPYLFQNLDQEPISYPSDLGDHMEWLWEKAKSGLSPDEIQAAFDELGEWIQQTEKNRPRDGVWKGLAP